LQPGHPTERADLRGIRYVPSVETEEGRLWNEAFLKQITGQDLVRARFMRQNYFTFKPICKLLFHGNFKPRLRSVGFAIERRLCMVHCKAKLTPKQRDRKLLEKLRDEGPGIARWIVEGCLMWQREGLRIPASVLATSQDYLKAQDKRSEWLEDCCDIGDEYWAATGALWASHCRWGEVTKNEVGSRTAFGDWLVIKFEPGKRRGDRGYKGLRLKLTAAGEDRKEGSGGGDNLPF
jgi:P4 family phage/plasmid primase-like protien